MKLISIFLIGLLLAGLASAYDPREASAGTPFVQPDLSLVTNDPFLLAKMGIQVIPLTDPSYALPGIFGGPMPTTEKAAPAWMDLTAHNAKLNATNHSIVAASSYDLTARQMEDVPLGQEGWL